MNDKEIRLLRQREQASSNLARKALDNGDAATALSLIKCATQFWPQNLVIFMSVIGFHQHDRILVTQAYALFGKQLEFCTKPSALPQVALWARNPSRKKSIPDQLRDAIDRRRRELEPTWDGVWFDGGTAPSNQSLANLRKHPNDIHIASDCLVIANQVADWGPWVNRYCSLGGSLQNPAYLKLLVAKAVTASTSPTPRIKGLLKKFTALGDVSEVRRFLRSITPARSGAKGINPNLELARHALYLYGECERLQHTVEDWVHIARSALYLEETASARIAQRILAGVQKSPDVEKVLQQLTLMNGPILVTQSPRDDVGIRNNPIWESLCSRIPVNADAGKIFSAYSRSKISS